MSMSRIVGVAVTFLLPFTPATHVLAQNDGEGASAAIEEIVVTARRREESIQRAPLSVTAFSSDDIDDLSIRDLSGTADYVPNVIFMEGGPGAGGSSLIYIRGVGSAGVDSPRSDTGVGVYVDGVFLPRMQGGVRDLLDLERIEILRGPQGTLFGKNTIGGAIHLITKRPSDEFYGSGRLTVGNYNAVETKLKVNVPVTDNFYVSFAGISSDHDGYTKNLTDGPDQGDKNRSSARVAARWLPNDRADINFSADYTVIREVGQARRLHAVFPEAFLVWIMNNAYTLNGLQPIDETWIPDYHGTFSTSPNQNHGDDWGVALSIDYNFGNTTLTSITSYRDLQFDNKHDLDGLPIPFAEQTLNTLDQDQLSQELRLAGTAFNDKLDWLIGAYYFDDNNDTANNQELFGGIFELLEALPGALIPPPPPAPNLCDPGPPPPMFPCWGGAGNPLNQNPFNTNGLNFVNHREDDSESYAFFVHGTYHFTDRWSVTAGLRYSHEEKRDAVAERTLLDTGEVEACPVATDCFDIKDSWDSWTPKVSLEFQASPEHLVYLSVSKGFKSGGFNSNALLPPFDPEELWAYELGFKTDWLDNRLRLNGAIFYNDYTDLQLAGAFVNVITGEVSTFTANAGSAPIEGAELEAQFVVTPNLTLEGTFGYLTNEFTDLRGGVDVTESTVIPYSPEKNSSISAIIDIPTNNGGAVTLRADGFYRSFTYLGLTNLIELSQPSYWLANARATYTSPDERWEVSVFGTNLTDEDWIRYGFGGTDFGMLNMTPGAPRVYGVSGQFNF
jgi:iron complex outermembrane receptor protein